LRGGTHQKGRIGRLFVHVAYTGVQSVQLQIFSLREASGGGKRHVQMDAWETDHVSDAEEAA